MDTHSQSSQNQKIQRPGEIQPLCSPDYVLSKDTNITIDSLKVVTYNIWFADTCYDLRCTRIMEILETTSADVICLQEVLPEFVSKFIASSKWVAHSYYASDLEGTSVVPYGILLLSKLPITKLQFVKLTTRMDRFLLLAEYHINGKCFAIGNVHLESLDSATLRAKQLEEIHEAVKDFEDWIVVGDFNFDSERNYVEGNGELENLGLQKYWPHAHDAWLVLNPDHPESGKTYDSDINTMIGTNERMRYDRIMYQAKSFAPVSCSMIGTEPINKRIWPSDHFGLLTKFSFTQ